jgi:hypothetical protein
MHDGTYLVDQADLVAAGVARDAGPGVAAAAIRASEHRFAEWFLTVGRPMFRFCGCRSFGRCSPLLLMVRSLGSVGTCK